MEHKISKIIYVMLLIISLCGCNVLKYLKPDEKLYTGAKIEISSTETVSKKQIKRELQKVLRPKPNQTIMGIRFKLWFYDIAGEDPKKGIKKWLKNKVGEKPVLYDARMPLQVSDIMVNRLNNLGYFNASVKYNVSTRGKKVQVEYSATVEKPYTINIVEFPGANNPANSTISESKSESLLKPGMQYDLDLIKDERVRIDYYMKNEGFYYFNPDHILIKADSTAGDKKVNLRVVLKSDIPQRARIPYFLDNIYIDPAYRLRDTANQITADTVEIDGYHYLNKDSVFHPSAIIRSVFLKKGEKYSRKAYGITISRLMGMGVFRNVSIKFHDTIINNRGILTAYINLTQMEKRSVQVELEAITKSNNYTGPGLTVSYKNRNLFKGAELLIVNLLGSFETQFTGIQKGFNSYELGANSQLYFPKFVTPFKITKVSSVFVPRTKIDVGVRNLNRVQYFKMNALNFSYGYTWKETAQKEHIFNPLAITFGRLMHTTKVFDDLLRASPFLKKSFEEQFTIGGNYSFTYNSLVNLTLRNQYFFNGMLDVSGNALNMIQTLATGRKSTEEKPHLLFGYRYSQYVKISTDTRYFRIINKNSKIATRLLAGIGIPYGNSSTLPYLKQFFSGGSNSIRAFLPRTVGPGTYKTPDSLFSKAFLDKAGDIKLEGNIEYRFTIISVLKGALFLDAGNVWLIKKTEQLPGAEFHKDLFYKQLAVGTGFGLRVDVTFFVLRFDLGMPLRKPYLPENERWVLNKVAPGNSSWRSQNLVLNIAIGYPF